MSIEYHRNMLADSVRNQALYEALKKVIVPGQSSVADVGSGTGILSFLAQQLGARDVYLYEHAGVMALSQRLAKANKITRCHFFPGHSTTAVDPPAVDIIVSETLGNYAFEEQMIETIEDAKRFLKPGGTIVPQQVEHFVAPVVTDRFFKELQVWDTVGFGLDFTAAKEMSLHNIYVRTFDPADLLEAQPWDSVDFRRKNKPNRQGAAQWTLSKETTIYGFAVWWRCELAPGVFLTTSPFAPKTHWEQLYFPVLAPLKAKPNDRLSVTIASTSSYDKGCILRWNVVLEPATGGPPVEQSLDLRKGFLA